MITYPPGGEGTGPSDVSWGDINGSVADQVDLGAILSSKIEAAHNHEGYAETVHNHDTYYAAAVHGHEYAATDHGHIGYSSATHNHDSAYSSATHAHDGVYSSASHNHEGVYSSVGHTHAGGASYDPLTAPKYYTDFYSSVAAMNAPWVGAVISSGHVIPSSVSVDIDHPGVLAIGSSGTAAGGYRFMTSSDAMVLGGGETYKLVFRHFDVGTSVTIRCGFSDILTSAAPADGIYMQFVGGQWSGWTANNSSRTQTGSSFSPSSGVWYTAQITLSAGASVATFDIKPSSGTSAWSTTIATNIPSSAGRYLGCGVLGTHGTSGLNNFLALDYQEMTLGRPLVR